MWFNPVGAIVFVNLVTEDSYYYSIKNKTDWCSISIFKILQETQKAQFQNTDPSLSNVFTALIFLPILIQPWVNPHIATLKQVYILMHICILPSYNIYFLSVDWFNI